ncbi:MAG: hypothetical protein JGK17_05630 [Microcoleus sp. PH2017_10_PVI_O_A]|uniref:hypothetical protein n=1 Tax=unclassified Microcoleus TaxID=2642155 RepID=UPI001DA51661|nr:MULTISPECIES: hypothetical protein [unclassified Microcoleus]TAE84606.1 MAG: hypothetical protein EAZ83_05270 [Oscillatoriales cyanobacterium]MCC3405067.1 hypothetical protein [Microcoleus sp. PH2017_10_PVI_O_A]MCC3459181.1 hypothetical protein [Microcoleus sp. PH2017_11_PCY_U_A]MCC3477310.1 hypothetical protein [Microcoleus sp. PH2017_12_PCY_D_A]MCC3527621.1 hypothetical protein [Microcoleus sp. PH2017_21_RUC_O_A]
MTSRLNYLGLHRRDSASSHRIPIANTVMFGSVILAGELKSLFLLFGILLKPRVLFYRDRAIDFVKISKV